MDEDLSLPALVVTQDIAFIRIQPKNYRTLNYVELISILKLFELLAKLHNCCCRLLRTGVYLDVLSKTVEIVCITPKLHNCCYRMVRTGIFLDVFFICPVLKTRIGGKRFLTETSSRGKSLKKKRFNQLLRVRNKLDVLLSIFLHEAMFK